MKALILSAGLGTRLRPLTNLVPKPLIPVINTPLIDLLIESLSACGFTHFGINLHHLPERIRDHLKKRSASICFSFEPEILGTGGGIAQFAGFLDGEECFMVHNGDIISTIDFSEALAFHERRDAIATLVLVDNAPTNVVKVQPSGAIIDIRNVIGARADDARLLTFSGIAIYSSRILSRMPKNACYSIIDIILEEIKRGKEEVNGYIEMSSPELYWRDIGSISSYMELHRDILVRKVFNPLKKNVPQDGRMIASDAVISPDAVMEGFVVVGSGAEIMRDVKLKDALVFPGTKIASHTKAHNMIFADTLAIDVQYNNAGE